MPDIKRLFSPEGYMVDSVTAICIAGCPIDWDAFDDDNLVLDAFGDFPTFETYVAPGNRAFVTDTNSTEFLQRHCRWISLDEEDENIEPRIDAWEADIVEACVRSARLHDGVRQLNLLGMLLPDKWLDEVGAAVIDNILLARMNAEIEGLEARIAAYRATRTEIEHLDEMPSEEQADA